MLKAAQTAEDSRLVISNAAIKAINAQSFMATSAGAYASQAERTISDSKKKNIKCFGCGENHLWSVKQPDRTFKIACPNQHKPGVKDKAKSEIEAMKKRRKDREEQRSQKKKLKSTSETSTTTTTTSVATSPGERVVFVVKASIFTAKGDTRLPMPIQIMNILPHVLMPLGATSETPNCPAISCAVDSCAGLNTGRYAYLMALAKKFPHCLYRLYTSREYTPINLKGIIGQDDDAVTTSLDCTFQFFLPFQMRGTGADCALAIAAGDNVAVNVILGLPFLLAMKSQMDLVDMLLTLNAIEHKPFPIDLRKTSNAVPILDRDDNVSAHTASPVLIQLQHYDQWRSSQVAASNVSKMDDDQTNQAAASTVSTMKDDQAGIKPSPPSILKNRVQFPNNPSASSSAVPSASSSAVPSASSSTVPIPAIPDPMVSCMSETQTLTHHNVERFESFM
jgi:hypothetical protein